MSNINNNLKFPQGPYNRLSDDSSPPQNLTLTQRNRIPPINRAIESIRKIARSFSQPGRVGRQLQDNLNNLQPQALGPAREAPVNDIALGGLSPQTLGEAECLHPGGGDDALDPFYAVEQPTADLPEHFPSEGKEKAQAETAPVGAEDLLYDKIDCLIDQLPGLNSQEIEIVRMHASQLVTGYLQEKLIQPEKIVGTWEVMSGLIDSLPDKKLSKSVSDLLEQKIFDGGEDLSMGPDLFYDGEEKARDFDDLNEPLSADRAAGQEAKTPSTTEYPVVRGQPGDATIYDDYIPQTRRNNLTTDVDALDKISPQAPLNQGCDQLLEEYVFGLDGPRDWQKLSIALRASNTLKPYALEELTTASIGSAVEQSIAAYEKKYGPLPPQTMTTLSSRVARLLDDANDLGPFPRARIEQEVMAKLHDRLISLDDALNESIRELSPMTATRTLFLDRPPSHPGFLQQFDSLLEKHGFEGNTLVRNLAAANYIKHLQDAPNFPPPDLEECVLAAIEKNSAETPAKENNKNNQ
jgi:hypothetical protein